MPIHQVFHVFMYSLWISDLVGFQTACIRALRVLTDRSDPDHPNTNEPGAHLSSSLGTQSCPELGCRSACAQLCFWTYLLDVSWSYVSGSLFLRLVPWTYVAPCLRFGLLGGLSTHAVALSSLLPLALFPFAPDLLEGSWPWLISCCAWAVNCPHYQPWVCLRCSDAEGLCPICEDTGCAGITLALGLLAVKEQPCCCSSLMVCYYSLTNVVVHYY